jgi:hypothetical protein
MPPAYTYISLPIRQALVDNMINSNTNLIYEDLRSFLFLFDEAPHLQNVFQALEAHCGLREVVLHDYPPAYNSHSGEDDIALIGVASVRLYSFCWSGCSISRNNRNLLFTKSLCLFTTEIESRNNFLSSDKMLPSL